jgi:uncharacterized protein (DUF1697 family)
MTLLFNTTGTIAVKKLTGAMILPMKYAAFLRGINVGGKTKIEMPRLKAIFEDLGCKDVLTYINSGNVIFSDNRPAMELKSLVEQAIADEFKLEVPVVIRDQANVAYLVDKIPAGWTNDKQQKTDVMFLWEDIDDKGILERVIINPKIERILYLSGALVWNIGRENVAKGGGVKLIKTDLYRQMTVRNINTVRKLHQLLSD